MPRSNEKYKLVALPRVEGSSQRFRVKALRDINPVGLTTVPAGTMGGHVDGVGNLAQEGECWIADEAMAGDQATVSGNASMRDRTALVGNAHLMHSAQMSDESCAMDGASISGDARVSGKTLVRGSARVSGTTRLHDLEITAGGLEDARIRGLDKDVPYVFDSSALSPSHQRAMSTVPCGAPSASGSPCTHMVLPGTQHCPAGHRPKNSA